MGRKLGFNASKFSPLFAAWLPLTACNGAAVPVSSEVPAQAVPVAPVAPSAPVQPPAVLPSAGAAAVAPQAPIAPQLPAGAPAVAPVASVVPAAPVAPLPGSLAAGAAAPASAAPQQPPPPPAATLTIKVPQVPPGGEDTQCVQIRMTNTAPVNVVKLHNTLSAGSHHFIVTALNDPMAPEAALKRCQGFGGAVTGAPLAITQAHDDSVQLSEGIGYALKTGQVMHLEMHYINTTDRPIDISATTELFAAAPGAVLQDAAVMLLGTADIAIPPRSMMESPQKFLKLPAGMQGVKFYQITGHTHRMGTAVNVSLAANANMPLMELYAPKNYDWEAPESKPLTPHLTVPPDGGFLLKCAWNNTSDMQLGWGESALDEMCFFWGYYYPRKDVFSIVVDNIDQAILKRVASMPPPAP